VEHLVELGHREILHVDGGTAPGAAERRTGYRNAMRQAGLAPRIITGGPTEDDGAEAARAIFEKSPDSTAVTVFNDRSAVGFLDAARQTGRRVPEDLSVIGFDNASIARLTHVDLTTVAQDVPELAALATQRAIGRLNGELSPPEQIAMPVLVSRTTTSHRADSSPIT
jgi:DNA-binding LacI/PurR family transcriptional regulator